MGTRENEPGRREREKGAGAVEISCGACAAEIRQAQAKVQTDLGPESQEMGGFCPSAMVALVNCAAALWGSPCGRAGAAESMVGTIRATVKQAWHAAQAVQVSGAVLVSGATALRACASWQLACAATVSAGVGCCVGVSIVAWVCPAIWMAMASAAQERKGTKASSSRMIKTRRMVCRGRKRGNSSRRLKVSLTPC